MTLFFAFALAFALALLPPSVPGAQDCAPSSVVRLTKGAKRGIKEFSSVMDGAQGHFGYDGFSVWDLGRFLGIDQRRAKGYVDRAFARGLVKAKVGGLYFFRPEAVSGPGRVVRHVLPIDTSFVPGTVVYSVGRLLEAPALKRFRTPFTEEGYRRHYSSYEARFDLTLGQDLGLVSFQRINSHGQPLYLVHADAEIPEALRKMATAAPVDNADSVSYTLGGQEADDMIFRGLEETFEEVGVEGSFVLERFGRRLGRGEPAAEYASYRALARGVLATNGEKFRFPAGAVSQAGVVVRERRFMETPFVPRYIVESVSRLLGARDSGELGEAFPWERYRRHAGIDEPVARRDLDIGADLRLIEVASDGAMLVHRFREGVRIPSALTEKLPPVVEGIFTVSDLSRMWDDDLLGDLGRAHSRLKEGRFSRGRFASIVDVDARTADLYLKRAFVRGLVGAEGSKYRFLPGSVSPSGTMVEEVRPLSESVPDDIVASFLRLREIQTTGLFGEFLTYQDYLKHVGRETARIDLALGMESGWLKGGRDVVGRVIHWFDPEATVAPALFGDGLP